MSRTRIIFFAFIAVFLGLIVFGLLRQSVSEDVVQQLFVAMTVFGVGVVLLDMLGLLGHHGADAQDALGDASHTMGHVETVGHAGDNGAGGHDGAHNIEGHQGSDHAGQGQHGHESGQTTQTLLSVLVYLRLLVYFCLGFGPIGLIALGMGRGALAALAFATPIGIIAVFLAQAFFRFQRKDTNSQIAPEEFVAQDGVVLVPLDDKTMGKVRVQVGMNVNDVYALASDAGRTFEKGEPVRIERVTDECVYVR